MEIRDLYRCAICGNVVELVYPGAPSLVCCGEAMLKMEARTEDVGNEKHVPVVEESDSGVVVKVGSVPHPMEKEHYIVFIEVMTKDMVHRRELEPGQEASAEFPVDADEILETREFCNVHMLWKN